MPSEKEKPPSRERAALMCKKKRERLAFQVAGNLAHFIDRLK